ncbi:MAG: hypothetical protein ABI210_14770, partial [Abditibacteriaceae bacterium]
MKSINSIFRKYKWGLFGILLVVVLIGFGIRESNYYTHALKAFAFHDYIAREYMPAERRRTKDWPTTLENLQQRITAGEVSTSPYSREQRVLEYYQNNFVKIESIQVCQNSYVYRITTKYWNGTCK